MTALSARTHFKHRPLLYGASLLGIFVLVASFAAWTPIGFLINIGYIVGAYFLFFKILIWLSISITCPHCSKIITTKTPWVCGFCDKSNTNAVEFPFVHVCEHCGNEPKAYKCHHRACGKLIFLSEDELETNYARCLKSSVEPPPVEKSEAMRREEAKNAIEHETMMTDLTAKLEASKARAEMEKKKSPKERLEKSFEDFHATTMTAHEIAEAKKEEIEEKYKDNPKMRRKAKEAIEEWQRRMT